MLNLTDAQVEERHAFADLDRTLRGTTHTHRRPETTVQLQDRDLLQYACWRHRRTEVKETLDQ